MAELTFPTHTYFTKHGFSVYNKRIFELRLNVLTLDAIRNILPISIR